MANLQQIITLTQEQYDELISNNTLTVNGRTYTYNENTLYMVPDNGIAQRLAHKLTFGNGTYVYDGSADVTVPVYTGTSI